MIETNRLILRKFTLDDIEAYFPLGADPDLIRYTGDEPFASREQARQTLLDAPLRDYEIHGYGRLACIEKSSGTLIGFAGLKYLADMDEVDLGYRFLTSCWGKGYASEASLAVMDHASNVLGLQRIIGIVHPDNLASVKVLQKVGMRYERKVQYGAAHSAYDLYATSA